MIVFHMAMVIAEYPKIKGARISYRATSTTNPFKDLAVFIVRSFHL
jgi:hypothetical protein